MRRAHEACFVLARCEVDAFVEHRTEELGKHVRSFRLDVGEAEDLFRLEVSAEHAADTLHWPVTETGVFFAVLSLLMVIVQGPVLERMSKKLSARTLTIGGTLVLCVGFACLYPENTMVIYLGAALIALGNGLMWPSVMAMLSVVAGDEHQGAVQGAGGSVSAVASIVGLIAGGLLYNWIGAWVFVFAAAVILPVAAMTPKVSAGQQEKAGP